ncbi:MAG: translational GTPase TypA [Chlamydiota bacterium]
MDKPEHIRNIAIIAHIDHGKTTLLDQLLKQANIFRETEAIPERVMDSYDQERERGITIFAKQTSVRFGDYKINIIDTPGHADFSGEVERVLGMVNSVLLLVDAKEGPMPQTRFVLSCALKMGLNPIVILNKIDRPNADPDRVLDETFDLFVELGASDKQLDFRYIYASGLSGYAIKSPNDTPVNLEPLFELIVEACPKPPGSLSKPFLMQTATITYDSFTGRGASGRILEGSVKIGDTILKIDRQGTQTQHRITKIEGHLGLEKVPIEEAGCGDIVVLSGIENSDIGDTLCDPEHIVELPPIAISEPTVSIEIMVNSSPFAGKEGKYVTMNKIKERLIKEKEANITLKIEDIEGRDDAVKVCGKGELHLAVLLETLRREGYECAISKPQVILKEIEGKIHEPFEKVHVEVPENLSGSIIEDLSRRKGEMQSLTTSETGITSMIFLMPTRGLMGYRAEFITKTSGLGILTSIFDSFAPKKDLSRTRLRGVLVSNSTGKANAYASFNLQNRGTLFAKPGDDVYEGQVVGEHSRDNDLVVNIIKGKQLTNVRASGTDENVILTPPKIFILEDAIDYIEEDELLEITPKNLRIRKRHLKEHERKRKKA